MLKKYNGMNVWLLIAGSLIIIGYLGIIGVNVLVGFATIDWHELTAVLSLVLGSLSAIGTLVALIGVWRAKANPLVTCLSGATGIVFGLWYFMPVLNSLDAIWLVIVAVLILVDYAVTRANVTTD